METALPPRADLPAAADTTGVESAQIGQNLGAVHDFYTREEHKRSAAQRRAESIGGFVGRPAFLVVILVFTSTWIGVNLALPALAMTPFDAAPFHLLQGVIALAALLSTTVVLIKQNRMAKLGEQRAHLDLKVMLLIEQKSAKLIDLLEELRRDLPNVKNRSDSGAVVMQRALSPEAVLAALDEQVTLPDGSSSNPESATLEEPQVTQHDPADVGAGGPR
jgi:uncharacterized membrane protein